MPNRSMTTQHREPPCALVAEDPLSRELVAMARRVAEADVTVMLSGESGVGKEVFARFIHRSSARGEGPFVPLNCAAIPETMLEAVLFGSERGAYTGADQTRPGKFEQAHGGTLLLDEVTEMPVHLQAKLLRVLQEREVERLGAARARPVDVRVLATSNRDLAGAVRAGLLREDLYFRLNVFPLRIPPLRERPADILPLAERLLRRVSGEAAASPQIAPDAAARLRGYAWPGNVRELGNVMERAAVLHDGGVIRAGDVVLEASLPDHGRAALTALGSETDAVDLDSSIRTIERRLIVEALRAEGGCRKDAAERLGISPRTLRYKLARLRAEGRPVAEA